ncbi:hypothetical protein EVAR_54276_1 [Eumeta japonica]|uniref:Uncharacterized protein n=1 Tax=Eumeta variegata TaxID=151549 RepID=A0A4C1YSC7_EUMVA|nr:hypothetical protein EVAR_54276_1 [Eumeta japonica]
MVLLDGRTHRGDSCNKVSMDISLANLYATHAGDAGSNPVCMQADLHHTYPGADNFSKSYEIWDTDILFTFNYEENLKDTSVPQKVHDTFQDYLIYKGRRRRPLIHSQLGQRGGLEVELLNRGYLSRGPRKT